MARVIADLGGPDTVTIQQIALMDMAVRSKLLVDSVDADVLAMPAEACEPRAHRQREPRLGARSAWNLPHTGRCFQQVGLVGKIFVMDEVSLDLAVIARRPDRIVTIRMKDVGRDVTREDAEAMIAALVRLDDQRPPLLILDGEKATLSFEAQRIFAQTDSPCAVALVTARYVNQLISNSLIRIFPSLGSKYPMRWFSSQELAEDWLRSVMAARAEKVAPALS